MAGCAYCDLFLPSPPDRVSHGPWGHSLLLASCFISPPAWSKGDLCTTSSSLLCDSCWERPSPALLRSSHPRLNPPRAPPPNAGTPLKQGGGALGHPAAPSLGKAVLSLKSTEAFALCICRVPFLPWAPAWPSTALEVQGSRGI